MSSLTPLISRSVPRFDPIYGDTRYRVPPPLRRQSRRLAAAVIADVPTSSDIRQFLTAFAGGLVFFSILIF